MWMGGETHGGRRSNGAKMVVVMTVEVVVMVVVVRKAVKGLIMTYNDGSASKYQY